MGQHRRLCHRKDKNTHALKAVDSIFDHSASEKGQKAYCKGVVHITLRVQIGCYCCQKLRFKSTEQQCELPGVSRETSLRRL